MVGTSKILTVSYGTFSCTLEGFDDSFNTMKAIAEYFRGLAADDRYFGAEPPTPDAELLAKIAEREISRRVDARMDDGEIVLRAAALSDQSDASEDDAQHDAESRAKVEAARKAAKAERKAQKAAEKKARKAAKAEAKAAKEAEELAAENAKAEAEAKARDDAKAIADAKSEAEDLAEATDEADTSDETSILNSVSAATAAPSEGTTGSDVEETHDTVPSSMLAADDPAPETAADDAQDITQEATNVPSHPDPESVAAKLQRIRAVVGKNSPAPSDDLTAQVLPQTQAPDVADVDVAQMADVNADAEVDVDEDDPLADFDAHSSEIEDAADDVAEAVEDAPAAEVDNTDMISRVMSRPAEATAEADVEAPAEPRARVIRMKRADFEKAMAENAAQESADVEASVPTSAPSTPDLATLDGADDLDDYLEDSDFTETEADLDDMDFAQDLKAISAEGDIEDVAEDAQDDTSALSAVSAALAAQTSPSDDDDGAEDIADDLGDAYDDAEDEGANAAKSLLAQDPDADEAALDRLLEETDVQMQEPEGSRRRDAIAQLKAAVAAKEAARQVGEPEDDGQDVENAFRNDLSEAVRPEGTPRPRPVVRSGARTERPRPAPLKLVAAQRVDVPETAKRDGPVVPRRVAARSDEAQAQAAAGSFAEFAENMGATELPDLLEAAAAYTAFVEGADEFSRPQILRRVRAVSSVDFNREDGLRSFAELLREGRFTKVRNGRFQVADDTRFNPELRAG